MKIYEYKAHSEKHDTLGKMGAAEDDDCAKKKWKFHLVMSFKAKKASHCVLKFFFILALVTSQPAHTE